MKPKFLYHGSPKKIVGNKLIPKQAHDLGQKPENLIKGVYATDIKDLAIVMAIICSIKKGWSTLNFCKYKKGKSKGIVYQGWSKQKYVYVYTLPANGFKQSKEIPHQFISAKSVKPTKIEKILVENYLYLVRKATKDEKERWIKRFGRIPK